MKSSLFNMVAVLLGVTAVASAAVGGVYSVTEEPIALAKVQKKVAALSQVLPQFDNEPAKTVDTVSVSGGEAYVYTARKGDAIVGYAVESSANGFAGPVKIMTGFEPDGRIRNIQVLEQGETPGLGAKLAEENNPVKASIVGRKPAEMKMSVRKDGGDVDAITASTISSRAYVNAVSKAYTAFLNVSGADAAGWDTSSGASASKSHSAVAGQPETAANASTGASVRTGETEDTSTGATAAQNSGTDTNTGATSNTQVDAVEHNASTGATSKAADTVASERADTVSGATAGGY